MNGEDLKVKFNLCGMGAKTNVIPSGIDEFGAAFSYNTGNLFFNYACELIADLLPSRMPWGIEPESVNQKSKGLLLPMANHIGKHVDLSINGLRLDGVDVPVVAMGLGAQFDTQSLSSLDEIPKGTIAWLRSLSEKGDAVNISLRGDFTYEVLERLGLSKSAVPLGCPSLFISKDRALGSSIKAKLSKVSVSSLIPSVAAGNPHLNKGSKAERVLINWVSTFGGDYIVQHPRNLICISNGWFESLSDIDYQVLTKNWFPGFSNGDVQRWFLKHSRTYISVPQWVASFSSRDLCVGTRIHGVQAAIQSGTPALCVYVDSRTKELCEFMKIPCVSIKSFEEKMSLSDVLTILETWDWDEFDLNRKLLANKTLSFLVDNGVKPSSHLMSLV